MKRPTCRRAVESTPLRSIAPKLPDGFLYGGDYNPEQWPEEIWTEDARLMKEAGVNLVSVGIFSWAKLEPRPGQFEFGWLERVIDLLWAHGISVCLANATASPPAWFSRAHPESLPVDAAGVRRSIGSRQHYCPNSRLYRASAAELSRKLAVHFSKHPAVALWHINNEVGCHSFECFCGICAGEFRRWLRTRYEALSALNDAWGTAFWSQAYGDWEEVLPPRKTLTFRNPGQVLDYARFMSDALRDIIVGEVAAIRSIDPQAKVTTNGLNFWRPADYWEWYKHVDIAAWDAYPDPAVGLLEIRATAFCHDLFRSLRRGQPFILMEQTASQVNWRSVNVLKAPGQMRALSWQAVAHGADGVMFFQWRASKAGAEKFHGAMLPHFGAEGRVHREVRELGAELKRLREITGTRRVARVAVLASWENRWALETESKPTTFDYAEIVQHHYGALWNLNVAVDIAHPDGEFDDYDVIVAPALYQLTRQQADSLRSFVRRGGLLVMSYFSGVADECDHIGLGGYPARLTDVIGLAVEEWQPLMPNETNCVVLSGSDKGEAVCTKFCELLQLRGAETVAAYRDGWYAGRPAITRHRFGQGDAIYLATHIELEWLTDFLRSELRRRGIRAPIEAGAGVELSVRGNQASDYLFVINHRAQVGRVVFDDAWSGVDLLGGRACQGETVLEPFSVLVLKRPKNALS
ncbi:MAG: beta-galactosidase [Nibricoccus sp.]